MAAVAEVSGEAAAANNMDSRPKSESELNVQKLVDMFKKLNPLAKEFFPSSYSHHQSNNHYHNNGQLSPNFFPTANKPSSNDNFSTNRRVNDCRICGDPHSVLRFAFVEFSDEHGARAALNLGGTMLGYYPVRVLPSKTAILPVNPTFLPRSEDEREMCARTVYCTNIDKKVSQAEVKNFFESACGGEVTRLRLLGDHVHSTRIAFVEFAIAESAIAALSCSGMVLGTQPIRVSPSKTPVRPRVIRPTLH
ncbi:polyadenylate-binding protein-interacting protein 9-like isoform X3 [Corylus avellana]|uniref:polyadenylate-binding protein-interacting protein 9-like isoform X3 n=1 Tax=Corylus avellana TaxID=13451 RepID=UPI00286C3D9A|nr:polyadenylate-binding protein-interacting protein 9-like isoform X3 [Corylus avellana]